MTATLNGLTESSRKLILDEWSTFAPQNIETFSSISVYCESILRRGLIFTSKMHDYPNEFRTALAVECLDRIMASVPHFEEIYRTFRGDLIGGIYEGEPGMAPDCQQNVRPMEHYFVRRKPYFLVSPKLRKDLETLQFRYDKLTQELREVTERYKGEVRKQKKKTAVASQWKMSVVKTQKQRAVEQLQAKIAETETALKKATEESGHPTSSRRGMLHAFEKLSQVDQHDFLSTLVEKSPHEWGGLAAYTISRLPLDSAMAIFRHFLKHREGIDLQDRVGVVMGVLETIHEENMAAVLCDILLMAGKNFVYALQHVVSALSVQEKEVLLNGLVTAAHEGSTDGKKEELQLLCNVGKSVGWDHMLYGLDQNKMYELLIAVRQQYNPSGVFDLSLRAVHTDLKTVSGDVDIATRCKGIASIVTNPERALLIVELLKGLKERVVEDLPEWLLTCGFSEQQRELLIDNLLQDCPEEAKVRLFGTAVTASADATGEGGETEGSDGITVCPGIQSGWSKYMGKPPPGVEKRRMKQNQVLQFIHSILVQKAKADVIAHREKTPREDILPFMRRMILQEEGLLSAVDEVMYGVGDGIQRACKSGKNVRFSTFAEILGMLEPNTYTPRLCDAYIKLLRVTFGQVTPSVLNSAKVNHPTVLMQSASIAVGALFPAEPVLQSPERLALDADLTLELSTSFKELEFVTEEEPSVGTPRSTNGKKADENVQKLVQLDAVTEIVMKIWKQQYRRNLESFARWFEAYTDTSRPYTFKKFTQTLVDIGIGDFFPPIKQVSLFTALQSFDGPDRAVPESVSAMAFAHLLAREGIAPPTDESEIED